jgi:hypothetical protein
MGYFSEMAIGGTAGEYDEDQRLDRLDYATDAGYKAVAPACKHPVTRQYAWHAFDGTLVVCCCDCGDVLKGSAE